MGTPKSIGRYEIIEELGHGAMGTVYRAKDPAMDRVVALKTILALALSSQQGTEFRERFYREARAAGRLAHPGIVPVFDVGEHEGLPFLVMEFIQGRTLEDAIRRGERPTLERACELSQQIAEALGFAHQNGVVHRDIKPANILLTARETYGIERPKITDFGVAKLAAGQITLSGQMLGTPAFMPPEQFTGSQIDGRADLFSLGVILYWMTTGEQPFPGETMTAVSYKVVHTEPVPPRKLNPSIPAALESIILKCLAKSPDERYQTGEELARDLAAVRANAKGEGTSSTMRQQSAPAYETEETIVYQRPQGTPPAQATIAQSHATAAPALTRGRNTYVLPAIAVVAVAAMLGGWYVLRGRQSTASVAPPPQASAPVNAPSLPPAPAVASAAAPPHEKAPAGNPVTATNKPDLPPSSAAPPRKPAPAAVAAAVDFDPRSLDPKDNAKLSVDAEQMPAGLDFTIEMNDKTYLEKSAEDNKTKLENLFVPPGIQEFRVTAQSKDVRKTSNIVSAEFKAKKRKTLKIELRMQGQEAGKGVPQDLYPNTQIVVTLK